VTGRDGSEVADPGPIRFGGQLWAQNTSWPDFRDAALALEAAGWDGVWTWDHLMAIAGRPEQPILEGWTAITAVAALTSRVTVGLMVGANTFRNPALLAKMATTLDHVSGGRAVLGLGGAWFEREHEAYGLWFGDSPGDRLARLDEAAGVIRRLLDGETVTSDGPVYPMREATIHPLPLQHRLPILIGGAGRRRTLRAAARHADLWNSSGTPEEIAERIAVLREHCAEGGRDPASIQLTTSLTPVIRDNPQRAEEVGREQAGFNGVAEIEWGPIVRGSPERLAHAMRPYVELGVRHFILRFPTPYDRETIERLGEVRAALEA
jgi:alkanesulfonate monooxygenase SsuD/methylene tetrahydromethanopterin reductase-like flavin-dependent oxidoreductase (luciferase family)